MNNMKMHSPGSMRATSMRVCTLVATAMVVGMNVGCSMLQSTGLLDARAETIHCVRLDGQIDIDGKADDAAWQRAQVVDDFYLTITNDEPRSGGKVRVMWDDKGLYVLAELQDDDLYAIIDEHDGYTWEDDVFEMFIKPREDHMGYLECHVNPLNTTMDLYMPRRYARNPDYCMRFETGMETAVTIDGTLNDENVDTGWTAEMFIPWEGMPPLEGKTPQVGDQWRVLIARYDYSIHIPDVNLGDRGMHLMSHAPLSVGSFHTYEQYGKLVFVDDLPDDEDGDNDDTD